MSGNALAAVITVTGPTFIVLLFLIDAWRDRGVAKYRAMEAEANRNTDTKET